MPTEFETTAVEFDAETGIGHLTLDRPDSLNALSGQLQTDIIAGLEKLDAENDEADGVALRAVVIEGAGGNFCAGADINEFSDASAGDRSDRSHYEFIRSFPVPIIAKIRGYCLGGGFETAMSCDFRLAHEDARLGLPEVDLGLIPGAGGVQLISELANPAVAREIAMTGDHISADRAHELNLVKRFSDEEFDDAVAEFAEKIASKPPLAIQAIKRSASVATQTDLEEGFKYDRQQFKPLLATEDHEKGARAFVEDDYEPSFTGR
ncbi:enoyl-CoA hydratase/isomerase family protein [Natrinema halophilum]|uniref:enoyl-CoA hydratase/isomerase family protein n=1 Tax=Natrinema halophilum TaxID=1699371 RepID=UPI001F2CF0E1|nr:enoyl-CoA hydratase/isomerase family protein [Natrinema halophilum]UHQ96123.1 enoyl-CoA hydratase/isomerase family protein [Natrinema halophilum]